MLRTERLVLRPLDVGDAAWIGTEIARPAVQRWLTSPPHPYTLTHAREFVARFGGSAGTRVIEEAGWPVGVITIEAANSFAPDRPVGWELGYWLRVGAWGRGLMTEAARAMLADHRTRHRATVHSGWISGNAGSARVLTKLGFLGPTETLHRHANFIGDRVAVERVHLPADVPLL